MEKSSSIAQEKAKGNACLELNELGLTKNQALKLDVFKYVMNHTKSVTTSFSVTNEIIDWLKS
jgi:hypothetical protein